jgi:hypothetical protein
MINGKVLLLNENEYFSKLIITIFKINDILKIDNYSDFDEL